MFCIAANRGIDPISCRNMTDKRKKSLQKSCNPFGRLILRKRTEKEYIPYERYSKPGIIEHVHMDSVIPEHHSEYCQYPEYHCSPSNVKEDANITELEATSNRREQDEEIQSSKAPEPQSHARKGFLELPPEIRNKIYDLLLNPSFPQEYLPTTHILSPAANLQRTCKTIYNEIPVDHQAIIYALHTMRLAFWDALPSSRLQSFRTLLLTQRRMVETPQHKYEGWNDSTYDHVPPALCAKGFKPTTLVFVTDSSARAGTPQHIANASPTRFRLAMQDLALALAVATSVTKAIVVDAAPTLPRYCDDGENTARARAADELLEAVRAAGKPDVVERVWLDDVELDGEGG